MSDDRWSFTRQTDGEFLDVLSIDNSTTIRTTSDYFSIYLFLTWRTDGISWRF